MPHYLVSPAARRDIHAILAWTHDRFGERGRMRYESLLVQAIQDVAASPHRNGRILQVGTPQEILELPRPRVVAEFVQVGNLFTGKVQSFGEQTELLGPGGLRFITSAAGAALAGNDVSFMIRPEHIHIDRKPLPPITETKGPYEC